MDISSLVDSGIDFSRDHTLWAALIALVIAGLIYWKPKGTFKVVMAALVLGAIIYVLSFLVDLTSEGIEKTKQFTTTPSDKIN